MKLLNIVILDMNQSIVLEIEMPRFTGAIEWIINFPDALFTMIADTRTMLAIPMTVPNEAKLLMQNSEKLMATKCALRVRSFFLICY